MKLISRINRHISDACMLELYAICRDRSVSDNNIKADYMKHTLEKYHVNFRELSPGTNRYAIRIDGYVFKIAMDRNGIDDNRIEFAMSDELQPFVAKTYECNDLIVVSEYVTSISKTEFKENEHIIKTILSALSEGYIFGDVGFTLKNFLNWGYRKNGELVILDYGYIYRIIGEEARCTNFLSDETRCGTFLEYDANFNELICPHCRRKYSYDDIRRRINLQDERARVQKKIETAYKLMSEYLDTEEDEQIVNTQNTESEEENMHVIDFEEANELFNLASMNPFDTSNRLPDRPIEEDDDDEYVYEESKPESDYLDDRFNVIEFFGVRMLFTEERINEDDILPDNVYFYHLRENPEGTEYAEIAFPVFNDYGGTILSTVPFSEDTVPINLVADIDYVLTNDVVTLRKYIDEDTNHDEITQSDIHDYRNNVLNARFGVGDEDEDEWVTDPDDECDDDMEESDDDCLLIDIPGFNDSDDESDIDDTEDDSDDCGMVIDIQCSDDDDESDDDCGCDTNDENVDEISDVIEDENIDIIDTEPVETGEVEELVDDVLDEESEDDTGQCEDVCDTDIESDDDDSENLDDCAIDDDENLRAELLETLDKVDDIVDELNSVKEDIVDAMAESMSDEELRAELFNMAEMEDDDDIERHRNRDYKRRKNNL